MKDKVYSKIKELILTYKIRPGMRLDHLFHKAEIKVSKRRLITMY